MISFNDIKNLFNPNDWDVGYLSVENLNRCALHPVKLISLHAVENYSNNIYFKPTEAIVLIRNGHTWDYTLYGESKDILSKTNYKFHQIHTNYKEAAILSGLGVRARNSLIYSYKFGFDHHITAFRFDDKITDIPTHTRINYKLWNRCVGCDDCIKACPVNAIHADGEPLSWWLDSGKCNDFIAYGNDKNIPSVKQFWHKNLYPEIPNEVIENLTSTSEPIDGTLTMREKYRRGGHPWERNLPWNKNGYSFDGQVVRKDGVEVDVPICRECTSQPRCSKWNGKYPYDTLGVREQRIKNDSN